MILDDQQLARVREAAARKGLTMSGLPTFDGFLLWCALRGNDLLPAEIRHLETLLEISLGE